MFKAEKPSDTEAGQVAVYSGVKTSIIKKFFDKFKKGSNHRILWIVGAIILISAIVFAAWWYATTYNIVATVDGQKISKSEVNDLKAKKEKFYQYNKDTTSQKNSEQLAINELTEDKIIQIEAKNRNISVSDAEISQRYKSIVSGYSSEAAYISTIKADYNLTPTDAKENIKIQLLKEKLENVVLKGYDLSYFYIRYDMGSDESKEDPSALPTAQSIYNQLKSGVSWDTLTTKYQNKQPMYSTGVSTDVLSTNFGWPEDWAAISKLKVVGDITQPIKSGAGYYFIYRADKIKSGSFSTWADFINYCKKKYVSYNSLDQTNILGKIGSILQDSIGSYLGMFNQKVSAFGWCNLAACGHSSTNPANTGAAWATGDYHPSIFAGHVYTMATGTRVNLNGATVQLRAIDQLLEQDGNGNPVVPHVTYTQWEHECTGYFVNAYFNVNQQSRNISGSSLIDSSDGGFQFGSYSTDNCKGGEPMDTRMTNGPDCHFLWEVKASKTGYIDNVNDRKFGQNGTEVVEDIELKPKTQDWTITPSVTVAIDGVPAPGGGLIKPGQTATWTHTIKNAGSNATNQSLTYLGKNVPPDFPDGTFSSTGVGSGFGVGATTSVTSTYTIPASPESDSKTYCRSTVVQPNSSSDSNAKESGKVCVWTGLPPPTPVWSVTPYASVNVDGADYGPNTTVYVYVGQTVGWYHKVTVDPGGPIGADVNYYKDGFGGIVNPGNSPLPNSSPPGSFADFDSDPYTIQSRDGGETYCRNTVAIPHASYDSGPATSADACVYIPYNYTLTPSVSLDTGLYINAGSTVTASMFVDNTGPTWSQPTQWKLTRTVNGANSTTLKSGTDHRFNVGSNSITPSYPDSDTDMPPGTKLCYILSVNPNAPGGVQVDSPPEAACVTIAKSPKTNIIRGDLIVGGKVSTSTATISGHTYGSWAEYGIIASGGISGAASGAAFAGPGLTTYNSSNPVTSSALTFANTGLTSGCDPTQPSIKPTGGCYKSAAITLPITASFPTSSTTYPSGKSLDLSTLDSGTYSATGNITIPGGNIAKGHSIIINAPNATVNITGDITYDKTTSLTSIKDIPQVVIIAQNINIVDSVTNIDAWLIAQDGSINTCSSVNGATLAVTDNLSAGICNTKLTVNGPVMTDHLYLRRTAGSGSGAASGDPAEVFNLPASAYLWSISRASNTGNVQTVYSTELPPRY